MKDIIIILIIIFGVVVSSPGKEKIVTNNNFTENSDLIKLETTAIGANADFNKDLILNEPNIKFGKFLNKKFGKNLIGKNLIERCNKDQNVLKLMKRWAEKGEDFEFFACSVAVYENGSFKTDTVGVCSRKYQINGDYRNCIFADLNSNGMDVGLIQANTFFQSKNGNIKRLGGPDCVPSSTKDRTDPCNVKLIDWLSNVDNNINLSYQVLNTQGLSAWSAFNTNVKPFI